MHNKKIIASGLVIGIAISSLSSDVTVNAINEYRVIKEEIIDNSSKDNKFENIIKNLLIKKSKSGRVIEGKVLNITLGENDTMPDLTDNPDEYEMIIVTTTGDRKLSTDDFSMLNISTIPNIDLSGAKANSIPSDAFINNTSLTGFKFPKGITSISNNSFNGCTNLSGVLSLPNSLTNIGDNAFYGCRNLTGDLIIPNSVSNIGGSAFRDCTGFNGILKLPDTITNIGGSAFYGCSKLTGNLDIPSSLKKISSNAFRGCSSFTGDLIIPDTVTVVDVNAFYGCGGFNGKLVLSNNIKSISANSFLGCSKLKGDIIIPEGVTSIGASAFYNCGGFDGDLKMPNTITSIGANAFYNCSRLSGELILSNSLKTVGRGVFSGTNFVGDVYIPNTLTTVDTNMFPNSINRIIIKVSEEDEGTEYRKNVINSFTASKVHIEAPYTLDFKGTWVEESNVNIIQPTVKNLIDGVENEVIDENNEKIALNIPMIFLKDECYALKDGEAYNFPQEDIDGKYIFVDEGDYEVVIKTKLGTTYNLQFGVRTKEMQEAEDLVTEIIDTTPTVYILEEIRKKVNALPESFRKEELQRILNSISVDLELERQTATSNLDVYIKSENMLKLSLDTNSIAFDNYSGTEDMIKSDAISLTVNSSLPYKVNASLESNIENKDGSNTIDISLLNIKASSDSNFKEFTNIKTPVILLDDQPKGNGAIHSIDLKLKGSLAYKSDIYKTTIKLEVEQK